MSLPGRRFRVLLVVAIAIGVIASACAQQEDQAGPTTSPADGAIGVKLQEWSVVPDESSAPAGEVTFDVSNVGEEAHEFMVVRTDLDLTKLPTKDDGSFDEEGKDVEVIDATNAMEHEGEEHEEIDAGDEKQFDYDLDAGKYVLLCNLVEEETEDGEEKTEVHFKLGMRIPFEAE